MQTRMIQSISWVIVLTLTLVFFPFLVQADQPEPFVECVEGQEPTPINYGEHTNNCQIDNITDMDRFGFFGSEGEQIRVIVSETTTSAIELYLEIWDPDGLQIANTAPGGNILVDLTLEKTGSYLIGIRENGANETGGYMLQLERVFPINTPVGISYDFPENDVINHITDMDFYIFEGETNDNIRVIVSETTTSAIELYLEIWDPDGLQIANTAPGGNILVDLTLGKSGTYLIGIRENGANETGGYEVEVQCLMLSCPDLLLPSPVIDITLNQNVFVTGDTLIISAHVINGPNPTTIEVKTWINLPDGNDMSILDPHLTLTVDPNANFTAEIFSYTFDGSEPSGDYNVGGRFINVNSGRQHSLDIESFSFSP